MLSAIKSATALRSSQMRVGVRFALNGQCVVTWRGQLTAKNPITMEGEGCCYLITGEIMLDDFVSPTHLYGPALIMNALPMR